MNKFRLLISMTMLLLSFIAVAGPGKREWSCVIGGGPKGENACIKDTGGFTHQECVQACKNKKLIKKEKSDK